MQLRRSEHRKVLRGMRCEKAGGGLDLPILRGIKQRKILHELWIKETGEEDEIPLQQVRMGTG